MRAFRPGHARSPPRQPTRLLGRRMPSGGREAKAGSCREAIHGSSNPASTARSRLVEVNNQRSWHFTVTRATSAPLPFNETGTGVQSPAKLLHPEQAKLRRRHVAERPKQAEVQQRPRGQAGASRCPELAARLLQSSASGGKVRFGVNKSPVAACRGGSRCSEVQQRLRYQAGRSQA